MTWIYSTEGCFHGFRVNDTSNHACSDESNNNNTRINFAKLQQILSEIHTDDMKNKIIENQSEQQRWNQVVLVILGQD